MAPRKADDDDMSSETSVSGSAFSGFESDEATSKVPRGGIFEKDSDEEELERLVLGNKAGFRESLFQYNGAQADHQDEDGDIDLADEVNELEDVADADLFAFDTGPSGAKPAPAVTKERTTGPDAAVWEDSDDDRLAISLANTNRLRKLRISEAEDVVSGTEYSRRLRQQYLRLNPQPAWATASQGRPSKRRRKSAATSDSSASDADDSDIEAQPLEKFLRDVNKLSESGTASGAGKRRLKPETLDIQRTREIPDRHRAPADCLSFHPEFPVLLSSSKAGVLYLHHIAPEAHPTPNPQLTSVQVKQVDVRRAEFMYPKGDKIFFAGRRRYFHHWDLPSGVVQKTSQIQGHGLEHKTMEHFKLSPCGRYMALKASTKKSGGIVSIISTGSMQWIASARMTSQDGIADYAWWRSGEGLSILGRDGQVGEYSVESKKFLGIWHDDGSVGGTVIALGGRGGPHALGEDRWVAVGSNTGITNIYERSTLIDKKKKNTDDDDDVALLEDPTPTRVFEQLITPITTLTFSPDGQLLAFASAHKKDALKLAHLPTCTVYRNWPTEQTPLGRISSVAFGRGSDLLAVGNDGGRIRMWNILS